jgi:hypothetical protein
MFNLELGKLRSNVRQTAADVTCMRGNMLSEDLYIPW